MVNHSHKGWCKKDIEALGATAAIGTMQDAGFLLATFKDADIVYLMEAWKGIRSLFDKTIDFETGMQRIGFNYKKAVEQSGVKCVVHLSSIGAHSKKGYGTLSVHYDVETILRQLPDDISIRIQAVV